MISKLILAVVLVACLIAPDRVGADVVLNFDSLPAAGLPNGLSGPQVTGYFASFGITLTNNSPASTVAIFDSRSFFSGQKAIPPSPFNFIGQEGSADPVSYTLAFSVTQDFFAMTRVGIIAGSTGTALPFWQASAFDSAGHLLGTAGENAFSIFSDIPAETFRINGPGIASVRIASDNAHFAALGSVILDDFTISTAVPEPSSMVLAVVGCVAIFGHQAAIRRRRSSR